MHRENGERFRAGVSGRFPHPAGRSHGRPGTAARPREGPAGGDGSIGQSTYNGQDESPHHVHSSVQPRVLHLDAAGPRGRIRVG